MNVHTMQDPTAAAIEAARQAAAAAASVLTTQPGAPVDPYFNVQHTTDGTGVVRHVVIETAYPLVLTQERATAKAVAAGERSYLVLDKADLEVYADVLTIKGNVSIPGRNVTLFARKLKGDVDNAGNRPAIVVDGAKIGPAPPDQLPKGAPPPDDPHNTKGKPPGGKGTTGKRGHADRILPIPASGAKDYPGGDGQGRKPRSVAYDPAMDGEPGQTGARGEPGGSIVILAGSLDVPDAAGSTLTLSACGGNAGKGQQGQDGADGGDGGRGADAKKNIGFAAAGQSRATAGGAGGDGGTGGKGGDGGPGGDGGKIYGRTGTAAPIKTVVTKGEGGEPGAPGRGGAPGAGGPGGKGFPRSTDVLNQFPDERGGRPGNKGQDGKQEDTKRGDDGTDGTADVAGQAASDLLAPLAHASQLQMLFERVRGDYLSADPTKLGDGQKLAKESTTAPATKSNPQAAWDDIGARLEWLASILKSFPSRRPDGSSCAGEKAVADQLLASVLVPIGYHRDRLDYFGKNEHFAPMLSLAEYDEALGKSLEVLAELETKRNGYFAALKASKQADGDLENALDEAGSVRQYLKRKLTETTTARQACQGKIDARTNGLESAKKNLERDVTDLEREIQGAFGLSAATLLNCISQLAFMGVPFAPKTQGGGLEFSPLHMINSSIMAVDQVATAIDEGVKNVLDDTGTPVNKDLLIKKLDFADDGSLKAALQRLSGGQYARDPQDDYRLVCRRDQIDELCGNFRTTLGASTKVASAMDAFVDLVDQRNRLLDTYNDLVQRELDLVGEIQKSDHQIDVINSERSRGANAGMPLMTSWVSGMYERVKGQCVEELYMAKRAYAFWALEPYAPAMTNALAIDHAALATEKAEIYGSILHHLEGARSTPHRFPDSDDRSKEWTPTGVHVILTPETNPILFDDLQDGFPGRFTLFPAQRHTKLGRDPDANPFAGKADVRLTLVRAFLIGMKTTNGVHNVTLTHTGHEFIQKPDDSLAEFEHEARAIPFVYDPDPAGDGRLFDEQHWRLRSDAIDTGGGEDGRLGLPAQSSGPDVQHALATSPYAPIGPFTAWKIRVRPEDNEGLDLTGLTKIVLDFHGFHRVFDEDK